VPRVPAPLVPRGTYMYICIHIYYTVYLYIYIVRGHRCQRCQRCQRALVPQGIYIYIFIYLCIYIHIYIYTNILYSLSMGVFIVSEPLDAQRRQRCQRHWCHKAYTYTYIYIYVYLFSLQFSNLRSA
jgi:hypothetical protein